MTETIAGATARNYVGGEWRESAGGETYEKRNPWRPSLVTGVYRFSTPDEAIERANAVRFGLSASIFTRDLNAVQRFTELLSG